MQERTDTAQPASNNGTPGAVDTGAYRAAWTTAMLPNGASVLNKRPYSPVIEGGRRIGMPVGKQGIINIADWAHRKLHIPVEQARSVAYAIAQEIKRRGLRARKVMSGGLGRMIEVVKIEIGSELGKELLRR
jgi:hypothetical protein